MSLSRKFFAQFRKPEGPLGYVAGLVMAQRRSGRARSLWTIGHLDLVAGDRVLEIGCGPGIATAAADRILTDGHIVGLDHSPLMVRQAARRNRRAVAAGRMAFVEGGVEAIGRFTEPFDKVFSVNVVHLVPDRPAFFAAVDGILRPGGTVATTYMPPPTNAPADLGALGADIRRLLEDRGYEAIRVETLMLDAPVICVLATRPARET